MFLELVLDADQEELFRALRDQARDHVRGERWEVLVAVEVSTELDPDQAVVEQLAGLCLGELTRADAEQLAARLDKRSTPGAPGSDRWEIHRIENPGWVP